MPSRIRPTWDAFCRLGPVALPAVIILPARMGWSFFSEAYLAVHRLVHDFRLLLL